MKKIKQKFEAIIRLTLALIITVTNFSYSTIVWADTPQKGDIVGAIQTTGALTDNPGDVELQKTISSTDEEGVFNVTLTATGVNRVTTSSDTASIYAAVVLDTSGSMDNCWLCIFASNKYSNAKKGARSFATNLLKKYSNAQLALIPFSNDVDTNYVREFANEDFSNTSFPSPGGLTNLGAGIEKATEMLLEKKATDPTANLYMVILSDGYPEVEGLTDDEAASAAQDKANIAKSKQNDIEIFTIGYDTGSTEKEFLKSIATDADHFTSASASSIVNDFSDIADDIEVEIPAGTNATITDVIADGFTYVEGSANPNTAKVDGQNISFDIGDITEEGTTVSFKIKIDQNLKSGWYSTNEGASITYDEAEEAKNIDDSAKVYWEEQEYNYTVNYYLDSVNGTKVGSVSASDVEGAKISASDIEINKFKPTTGYKDGVISTAMPYEIIAGENVINVVYSKKDDLSYVVEYYKDNNKISDDSENTVTNQTFGNQITEDVINKNKYKPLLGYQSGTIDTTMPYTIIDGTNIIKVSYQKRTDMSYTVKYLEKDTNEGIGLTDEIRTGKTFEEVYTETAKEAPYGYKLVGATTQEITVDEDNKVVTFYYEKRNDFSYKVNYLEEGTNKVLSEAVTRSDKTYLETYTETAININGYNVVGEQTQKITLSEDGMEITFYYTKKDDLSYTVNYYKDSLDGEKIASEVIENQIFGSVINDEDINVDLYRPVGYKNGQIATILPYMIIDGENVINVIYTKKDDLTYRVEYYFDGEIDSSKTDFFDQMEFGTIIKDYKDKLPKGYIFVKDTAPLTIEDTEDNVIKVYYESIPQGELTPPKTGIDSNNYLAITYFVAVLSLIVVVKKKEA